MKTKWFVILLSAFVLQAGASMPASADTAADKAFKKQHEANRESDKAALARTDARVAMRHGHGWWAERDIKKSRKESEKAYKHSQEAKTYRSIARHGRYYRHSY